MPRQNIEKIRKEASSRSINKWVKIISKEVGIEEEDVEGESPTERMYYVIGQLKRKKNQSSKDRRRVSKKLQKRWKKKNWEKYQPW